MDLILFLKLVRYDSLRIGIGIGIEFHSLCAVYEYDLSNKEERDLGTASAPLTIAVYDFGFQLLASVNPDILGCQIVYGFVCKDGLVVF